VQSGVVRKRVLVKGRVQGVFFRDTCLREAERYRVYGWVRNRADGSVEATFEGSSGAVAHMIGWCRTGPPRADVVSVEEFDEEPEGATSFYVR
jgi:acylphosphatase